MLIPSYNTGPRLAQTAAEAIAVWPEVWVVIDGSTDNSDQAIEATPGLRILLLPNNIGKGAAVLHGISKASAEGFTHVLTLDADGQHCVDHISEMMALSGATPRAMILGTPVFGPEAPLARVLGRRISNLLARLLSGADIHDSLYGMRVYPIADLLRAFGETRWMRRYDFDAEAAIRLCRMGVTPINMPTPVRYFAKDEGGVSHFRYLRDNLVLAFMFARLLRPSRR